jgi:hypothetical protein
LAEGTLVDAKEVGATLWLAAWRHGGSAVNQPGFEGETVEQGLHAVAMELR